MQKKYITFDNSVLTKIVAMWCNTHYNHRSKEIEYKLQYSFVLYYDCLLFGEICILTQSSKAIEYKAK